MRLVQAAVARQKESRETGHLDLIGNKLVVEDVKHGLAAH